MFEKITSPQNPRIKNLISLQRSRERRLLNRIIIEGYREISLAMVAGFPVRELFSCRSLDTGNHLAALQQNLEQRNIFEISLEVFEKLAYREASDGLIAVAEPRFLKLQDVKLSNCPLVIVLEAVEKPGNFGAVLRTADAARVDAVIVCDPLSDLYNPNAIRASIGCIFTLPVVACTTEHTIMWLRSNKIKMFATALTATHLYHESHFRQPAAIIMGSEASGLSQKWLDEADHLIKIPMRGKIDSMNVSASAAVVIFEAQRQRNFS